MAKELKTAFPIRIPDNVLAWLRQEGARQDRSINYLVCKYLAAAKEQEELANG